jgi:hypothetical protein
MEELSGKLRNRILIKAWGFILNDLINHLFTLVMFYANRSSPNYLTVLQEVENTSKSQQGKNISIGMKIWIFGKRVTFTLSRKLFISR